LVFPKQIKGEISTKNLDQDQNDNKKNWKSDIHHLSQYQISWHAKSNFSRQFF